MTHRAIASLAAILIAGGCSSSPSVETCDSDAQCGAGNLCQLGACAANAPPVADFAAPADVATHRLVPIAPTVSDPEGRAVTVRWTVEATVDGCAADVDPGEFGAVEVVFWCAGTYAATAVPVDEQGLEGAPRVRSFEVTASTGAPTVTAAAAIAASHACEESTCTVLGPGGSASLQLGATADDPSDRAVSFEWVPMPNEAMAADPTLLVSFLTSAESDAPVATIANSSGGPIAGTYRFRVRAVNVNGLIGQAIQEVVVANGAPTAKPGSWLVPHTYTGGHYVAEGDVETGAADPDGDVVSVAPTLSPEPPAGCTEVLTPLTESSAIHVRIDCATPGELIGATPRTLSAVISDSNGASISISAPLVVVNRPPEISLDPSLGGILTLDHRVEPCLSAAAPSCFVADGADPFVFSDPEGDPLGEYSLGATQAPAQTSSSATPFVVGGRSGFRLETPVGKPLEFRSASGGTAFRVTASVPDVFGAMSSLTVEPKILNRAPFVKESAPVASVPHTYDPATLRYVATVPGPLLEDPDGDPISLSVVTQGHCDKTTVEAGRVTFECALAWDYRSTLTPPLAHFLAAGSVMLFASDLWESVGTTTAVTLLDRPTTFTVPTRANVTCRLANGIVVPLPVELTDPDGDPSRIQLYSQSQDQTIVTGNVPGTIWPELSFDTFLPGFAFTLISDAGSAGAYPVISANSWVTICCSNLTYCPP